MTAPRPWSTQPITGTQHDAWMVDERKRVESVRRADVAFLESQIRGKLVRVSAAGQPSTSDEDHQK